MATVLRGIGAGVRGRCRYWLRQVEAFALAVLLAGLLSVPTVRAQTLLPDGTLNWGVTSTGPSSSTVNGTNLVIAAAALAIGFVATGGASAAVAVTGRALTVAGSVVGPIAANMLRAAVARGPLAGAMLGLAVALGSDAKYDAASNSFLSIPATGGYGYKWYLAGQQSVTFDDPVADCTSLSAVAPLIQWSTDGPPPSAMSCGVKNAAGQIVNWRSYSLSTNCATNYVKQGSTCVYAGVGVPTTDAQLSAAIQKPAALAKVWDAGGCPQKITTFRDTASADDPCAQIVGAPGGTWTPVTVPNGGAVSLPSQTQTVTDSTGKVTGTITKTPTAQVSPNTNQATMAASPVIVQGGSVVKTTTNNADGTQTTTTTTTTNPATTTDTPQDGTATFNAGTQDLYTKKSRTWAQVLADFQAKLQQAPWYVSASSFFNVSISGGACPHWTVSATKWTPAMDAGVYVCSSSMMALYQTGGIVVMIVAAWAAFRIAFL